MKTRAITEDNGILSHVPGSYVGEALNALPDAETASDDVMKTVLIIPHLGAVRFTCERRRLRSSGARVVFWCAVRAERVRHCAGPMPEYASS